MQRRTCYLLVLVLFSVFGALAQGNLYTSRGYWEETTKPAYRNILQKIQRGDSLSKEEKSYQEDFESFLKAYFQKMSQVERDDYFRMKETWDKELVATGNSSTQTSSTSDAFEWRTKDRLANGIYGLYYGAAAVGAFDLNDQAAATAIPLLTSGAWLLGPAINRRKFDNVTRTQIRTLNTGRLLGLVYGTGLGLAVGSNSDDTPKWILGLSAFGSIVAGEIAFKKAKQEHISAGRVEMARHYGILGPWIALSLTAALGNQSSNVAGASIVAGGLAGIPVGNKVFNLYNYSRGDVDAISSLTLITTGVGLSVVGENNPNENRLYWLIPALGSVAGTILAQKAVRGAHLTDQQGTALNLATAGSALVGLGIVAWTKTESSALTIGIPTAFALIVEQSLFHSYKKRNFAMGVQGSLDTSGKYRFSMRFSPEGYFINRQIRPDRMTPQMYTSIQQSLVRMSISF